MGIRLRVHVNTGGRISGADHRRPGSFQDCEPTDDTTKLVLCTLDFLHAGESAYIRLNADLQEGQARLDARVSAFTKDLHPRSNSSVISLTVVPPKKTADLGVDVSGPSSGRVAESLMYTVHVTNYGPDDAAEVEADTFFLTDDPIPVLLQSVVTSQGTCMTNDCLLGSIRAGDTVTITLVVSFATAATVDCFPVVHGADDTYDPGAWDPTPPGHPNGAHVMTNVVSPRPLGRAP